MEVSLTAIYEKSLYSISPQHLRYPRECSSSNPVFIRMTGLRRPQAKASIVLRAKRPRYGYIGHVEELPGANTQGTSIEETKRNLIEAIELVLEANRQLSEEEIFGKKR